MSKFIKLTDLNGDVKTDIFIIHIKKMFGCENGSTGIYIGEERYTYVKENIETVEKLIEEARND